MELRKAALRMLIVSIVISGGLAIIALVTGDFGDLQIKILLSAIATSAASICGMACGAAWDRDRWRPLAAAGMALAIFALAAVLAGLWTRLDSDLLWKSAWTAWAFSIATAHTCLLGLARGEGNGRWIRALAIAAVVVLAIGISLPVWNLRFGSETGYFRGLGVIGVVMLVASLSLPVLQRLRVEQDTGPEAAAQSGHLMCPSCGHSWTAALGRSSCPACGTGFRTELL